MISLFRAASTLYAWDMEHVDRCAYCGQSSAILCRRCGRSYCPEHGDDLCVACLEPASAVPSARLYQTAAGAFLVAAVLGLWFLIAAPRLPGEAARTAQAAIASQSHALIAAETPTPVLAFPSPFPTPDLGPHDYTIKAGDTLDAIAKYYGVTIPTLLQLNPQVNPTRLQIGQVIHIPAR